jgi:hypothetical protein
VGLAEPLPGHCRSITIAGQAHDIPPDPKEPDLGVNEKPKTEELQMVSTAILNAVLALGVIVIVVAPLVWAIMTQHRDHPHTAATDSGTVRQTQRQTRLHAPQPQQRPVIGRA